MQAPLHVARQPYLRVASAVGPPPLTILVSLIAVARLRRAENKGQPVLDCTRGTILGRKWSRTGGIKPLLAPPEPEARLSPRRMARRTNALPAPSGLAKLETGRFGRTDEVMIDKFEAPPDASISRFVPGVNLAEI